MRSESRPAPSRPAVILLLQVAAIALAGLLAAGCDWLNRPAGDPRREGNFQEGLRALDEARWLQAKESFLRSLESNPDNLHAHLALGDLYRTRLTNHALALFHYHRYLDLGRLQNNGEFRDQSANDGIRNSEVELARRFAERMLRDQQQFELDKLRSANVLLQEQLEAARAQNNQLLRQAGLLSNAIGGVDPARMARGATNPPVRMPPEVLNQNQPLRGSQPQPNQPVTTPATPRTHQVQSGESLSSIARRYNVRLQALQAANPSVDSRRLRVGQVLNIPPR